MSDLDPDIRELVGRVVGGKIVLEEYLGGGSMGAVFRAHHTTLSKPVAVEVLGQASPAEERLYYAMAYVLMETDLLLRPIRG